MPLSFSRYVRFIFHVCPVLSLRVISLHLPSSRLVSLSFVSLSFFLRSPCFHFCPFHVPFSSPVFPFHFPFLSCHVDFLCPPLISLHVLAFPLCFPQKNTVCSSVFAKMTSNKDRVFQIFCKRSQETQTNKEPAGGFEPGTPVDSVSPKTTFSGASSSYPAVRGGSPPLNPTYPLSSLPGGLPGAGTPQKTYPSTFLSLERGFTLVGRSRI